MTWTKEHKKKYFCKAQKEYSKEYRAWCDMRQRCNNTNYISFQNYGGRNIKICNQWENFDLFLQDMGRAPLKCSLDRINNDGDYEPSNCRWADRKTQQRNRRNNKRFEAFGKSFTLGQWAELVNIPLSTLKSRIYQQKINIENALKTPYKEKRSSRTLVSSLPFQGKEDGPIPS